MGEFLNNALDWANFKTVGLFRLSSACSSRVNEHRLTLFSVLSRVVRLDGLIGALCHLGSVLRWGVACDLQVVCHGCPSTSWSLGRLRYVFHTLVERLSKVRQWLATWLVHDVSLLCLHWTRWYWSEYLRVRRGLRILQHMKSSNEIVDLGFAWHISYVAETETSLVCCVDDGVC